MVKSRKVYNPETVMEKPFVYGEGKFHLLSLKPGLYDKGHVVCLDQSVEEDDKKQNNTFMKSPPTGFT